MRSLPISCFISVKHGMEFLFLFHKGSKVTNKLKQAATFLINSIPCLLTHLK